MGDAKHPYNLIQTVNLKFLNTAPKIRSLSRSIMVLGSFNKWNLVKKHVKEMTTIGFVDICQVIGLVHQSTLTRYLKNSIFNLNYKYSLKKKWVSEFYFQIYIYVSSKLHWLVFQIFCIKLNCNFTQTRDFIYTNKLFTVPMHTIQNNDLITFKQAASLQQCQKHQVYQDINTYDLIILYIICTCYRS